MLKKDISFLENISKTIVRKVIYKIQIDKLFADQVFSKPSYRITRWGCGTTQIESLRSGYYSKKIELDSFHKNYISIGFNGFSIGNFTSVAEKNAENQNSSFYRSFHFSNEEINKNIEDELGKNIELFLTKEKIETLKTLLQKYGLIKNENESWKEKFKVRDYFNRNCAEHFRVFAHDIKCEDVLYILTLFKEEDSSVEDDELLILCLGNDEKIKECVILNEDYEIEPNFDGY